jgi:hypothetical protein
MSDPLADPRYTQPPDPGRPGSPGHTRYDVGEQPSFAEAVAQARAAMAGQRQWDGYITAPAVLAEALTGELAEIRVLIDELRQLITEGGPGG